MSQGSSNFPEHYHPESLWQRSTWPQAQGFWLRKSRVRLRNLSHAFLSGAAGINHFPRGCQTPQVLLLLSVLVPIFFFFVKSWKYLCIVILVRFFQKEIYHFYLECPRCSLPPNLFSHLTDCGAGEGGFARLPLHSQTRAHAISWCCLCSRSIPSLVSSGYFSFHWRWYNVSLSHSPDPQLLPLF